MLDIQQQVYLFVLQLVEYHNSYVIDEQLIQLYAKIYGFTDFQIARAVGLEDEVDNMHKAVLVVRQ